MSRCIIVLGLPRSGTSAVAGTLHRLGVDMGAGNLQTADALNPRGYYEDRRWQHIHKEVAGQVYSRRFVETLDPSPRRRYQRLVNKLKSKELWGFKTPRACFTLHHITPMLAAAGVETRLVVVRREFGAVVRSILRHSRLAYGGRFEMTIHQATALIADWDVAFDYQLAHFRGAQLAVTFPDWLDAPLATAERLAEFAGLTDYDARAAIEWLDSGLVTQ